MDIKIQQQPPSLVNELGADVRKMISLYIKEQEEYSVHNHVTYRNQEENKNIFRFVSYNVHFWLEPYSEQKCISKIFSVIREVNADCIVIEEFNDVMEDNLNWRFDKIPLFNELGYTYHTCGEIPIKNISFVPVIFSKFPLSNTTYHNMMSSGRIFVQTNVTLPNEEKIKIFGIHLDVYDDTEDVRMKEIQQLLRFSKRKTEFNNSHPLEDKFKNTSLQPETTSSQQLEDSNKKLKEEGDSIKLETTSTHLILGDFNSLRRGDYSKERWDHFIKHDKLRNIETKHSVIDYLEQNSYVDCFSASGVPVPQCTTWSGRRIDFIFLSPDWKFPIVGCFVYHDPSSDHIPVICDFQIN